MAQYAVTVDIEKLVHLVQERTCLWDNRDRTYRNKVAKEKAWAGVFAEIVGENWKCMNNYEQNLIGSAIQKRWRSLRDRYKKRVVNEENAVRSGSGRVRRTKHLLFEHLLFLRPKLSIRTTVYSTVASSISTQKDTQVFTDKATEAPEEQPEVAASIAGASKKGAGQLQRKRTYPLINLGRRAVNRVDMAALITMMNNSLGAVERTMERLRLDVVQLYPTSQVDAEFIQCTLNAISHVPPALRPELRVAMHDLIGSFMHRALQSPTPHPPPSYAPAAQGHRVHQHPFFATQWSWIVSSVA